ncbi:CyaY protein [Ectothiorhodosinus mongolicus]|uniref:Iron-sulfur cluster assembly protein CyaY n=1 Tax=Ectothiorhodosinus mongolicus TaxID=233100 RepID=A0A1R3VN45_9GAMM|nr:iron donor protein CyaY [Ectothiorhodosinus mongolicus]ULX56425.1 iron donor protein CyaY [Ectothiorhodosinus mongolicus]SIT65957.1 CyaY protein [Ectothiorhodosinus mongolicus]
MSNASFAVQADEFLEDLVERMSAIDSLADLDADIVDGVLKVEFDDGSKLIINRQEPVRQIWLASPEGPAHYSRSSDGASWEDDKTGEDIYATLNRVFSQKMDEPISL